MCVLLLLLLVFFRTCILSADIESALVACPWVSIHQCYASAAHACVCADMPAPACHHSCRCRCSACASVCVSSSFMLVPMLVIGWLAG
jgi:hypothetical protein